jgi:hypothetical protein
VHAKRLVEICNGSPPGWPLLCLGLNDCSCCDGGFNRSLVPRPEGKFRLRHGGCIAMGTDGGQEVLVGLDFARRAAGSVVKVLP